MEIVCRLKAYRRFESSSLRHIKGIRKKCVSLLCFLPNVEEDSREGAVLREQNALPTKAICTNNSTAKDAIDNGGAGRAAKGANPLLCAKQKRTPIGRAFFVDVLLFITIASFAVFQKSCILAFLTDKLRC